MGEAGSECGAEFDRGYFQRRYEECLRLYVKTGGRNLSEIEREMKELGYSDFSRRIFYPRNERGIEKPGWLARFGQNLTTKQHENTQNNFNTRSPEGRLAPAAFSKRSFKQWLRRVCPSMTWDWPHQDLLYKYLERVTSGDCKRLMIFMPPRHGKSELVTVRYLAWRLAHDPTLRAIIGSYNQRLANRFSRKVRRVMADAASIENEQRTTDNADSSPGSGSPQGTNIIAQGKAEGRNPGYRCSNEPLPEREQQHTEACKCRSSDQTQCRPLPPANRQLSTSFRPSNSIDDWETIEGGGVRAVGVGAGVTGYGANLIIIDDPVKNRAEAESETYRDKLSDWYKDDISTRLEPNGAVIIIQTRWHEDDLSGRLLKEMNEGGEPWTVLSLPAFAEGSFTTEDTEKTVNTCSPEGGLAPAVLSPTGTKIIAQGKAAGRHPGNTSHTGTLPEGEQQTTDPRSTDPLGRSPGEALCRQRYDEIALAKVRRALGEYSFAALYQQRPTPLDGGLFKRKWMTKTVDRLPPNVKLVRTYDLAVSTKTTADFTVSVLAGFDPQGTFYIADVFRRRMEYPEQRRFVLNCLMRERHVEHGIELALHGQALVQDLRRVSGVRSTALRGIKADTDKVTRALAWANLAEEGRVVMVRGPWIKDFVDEICSFPNGRHDDQVDAVSLAISLSSKRRSKKFAGF